MRRELAAPQLAMPGIGTVPLLCLLLAGLLAVRLVALALNGTDLFFDEAQYWTWAREPAFGYYSKPPLIAALIGATTAVCGDGTFCVRLSAPLLHTATAGLLFLVARRLYDDRTALWSAITFATLPGISLSSGIVSTDVPLLTAWALALLGLVGLVQKDAGWAPAWALGLGLGLGLNAKYAMAFFPASVSIWLLVTPAARGLLRDSRLWAALALGMALIAPNLIWNAAHKFATFAHTADNAKWSGGLLHPDKGLEFLLAQLAVFGPILVAALVMVLRRGWRAGLGSSDRLLVCLGLPVLAVITAQAFLSRAHANWAATAYVSLSILVPAALLRLDLDRWLKASLGLHLAVLALLAVGTAAAGHVVLPLVGDPFQRTLGWSDLGERTRTHLAKARAAGHPFAAVITDERAATAELLYYLRDEPTPVLALQTTARPLDHYELTRPLRATGGKPILMVSLRRDPSRYITRFRHVTADVTEPVPAGLGRPREVRFVTLEDLVP